MRRMTTIDYKTDVDDVADDDHYDDDDDDDDDE